MAFAVKGINVDLMRSNESNVTLKNVNKHTSGLFKCQVSVENTFKSVSAERRLKVEDHHQRNPNRANAESLLGQTYQPNSNGNSNNNRQMIANPTRPSNQSGSSGAISSAGYIRLGVAQLLIMYIIFQSILSPAW